MPASIITRPGERPRPGCQAALCGPWMLKRPVHSTLLAAGGKRCAEARNRASAATATAPSGPRAQGTDGP